MSRPPTGARRCPGLDAPRGGTWAQRGGAFAQKHPGCGHQNRVPAPPTGTGSRGRRWKASRGPFPAEWRCGLRRTDDRPSVQPKAAGSGLPSEKGIRCLSWDREDERSGSPGGGSTYESHAQGAVCACAHTRTHVHPAVPRAPEPRGRASWVPGSMCVERPSGRAEPQAGTPSPCPLGFASCCPRPPAPWLWAGGPTPGLCFLACHTGTQRRGLADSRRAVGLAPRCGEALLACPPAWTAGLIGHGSVTQHAPPRLAAAGAGAEGPAAGWVGVGVGWGAQRPGGEGGCLCCRSISCNRLAVGLRAGK